MLLYCLPAHLFMVFGDKYLKELSWGFLNVYKVLAMLLILLLGDSATVHHSEYENLLFCDNHMAANTIECT